MKSSAFAFEGVQLNNNALIMTQGPASTNATITGIRFSLSMGFAAKSVVGFAECLFQGIICTGKPTFGATPYCWPSGPVMTNSDFGPATLYNPNNVPSVGPTAGGYTGQLFSVILKSLAPSAANSQQHIGGLSIPIAAGDYLVFYMAHESENTPTGIPADCEMQGTLFY